MDPFVALATFVVRLRWLVVAVWLVLLLAAGALLAPRVPRALLGGGFQVPGSESTRAAEIIDREFDAANRNTLVIVFRSDTFTVDTPPFRNAVQEAERRLAAMDGMRSIDSFFQTGNPLLVGSDRRTSLSVAALSGTEREIEAFVGRVRTALADIPLEHYVTGQPASNVDVRLVSEEDLRRAEFITLPIAAILLLIVFRTVVATLIPLALGASSVVLALAIMYLLTFQTDISIFALNTASMIGLGLGIDFSLLLVNRFDEELMAGRRPHDAVIATMASAGRSITYSGLTVFLAMLLLTLLFDLLVVRSMSLAVMLVAATSLVCGLTLLPALLAILGHRIHNVRVIPRRLGGREPGQPGFWYRLSHTIMRRPWAWLWAGLVPLAVLTLPLADLGLMGVAPTSLPDEVESTRGVKLASTALGGNRLEPIQIVMLANQENGVWTPEFLYALQRLTEVIDYDPRIDQVLSLSSAAEALGLPPEQFSRLSPQLLRSDPNRAAQASRLVNLSRGSSAATITVFVRYSAFTDQHQALVRDIRERIVPALPELRPYRVYVGGLSAGVLDYGDALYGRFPLLVLAVLAMTFVILMMFFRSVLLPAKAILLNAVTILATYGALILIFEYGYGAGLLGFEPQGKLMVVTPALLFVILFSLSTDYEVFLLSRVKEEFERSGDNTEAVARGLDSTARVITAAGLVLVGTFASFGASRILFLKELGLGLAIGILLDTTIVRLILVPATMRLMGNANWWMPGWLQRVLPTLHEGPSSPGERVQYGLSAGELANIPDFTERAPTRVE
ncbi:MAG TPA: MMPL family transporter [Chloroflexota bacterium]